MKLNHAAEIDRHFAWFEAKLSPRLAKFVGWLRRPSSRLVRIPLAYWLAWDQIQFPLFGTELTIPGWGLGVRGAWYAMIADLMVRCLLVVYRFLSGAWKRIEV